jgi:3-oxoacid CoA-transferase subunit A
LVPRGSALADEIAQRLYFARAAGVARFTYNGALGQRGARRVAHAPLLETARREIDSLPCRAYHRCDEEYGMNKVYPDAIAALSGLLDDGMTIMAGGFGLSGIPEKLIAAIKQSGVQGLTVVSNNAGVDGAGLGLLLETRQIKKMISSYVGENKLFADLYLKGELELEFNPQGTLAERIRAGGAGIPAFFTKTGVGTLVAEGKETREFDDATYVMERGLFADLAVIHAWKADTEGNLVFRKTARNFNPVMATAAKTTVVEVEQLVPAGEIDPDQIHTPGIFVQRIVHYDQYEKRIEQRTVRKRA